MSPKSLALVVLVALGAAACHSKDKKNGGDETPTPVPTAFESADGNVKFKRSARIRNDFSEALGLTTAELCLELGNFSCTDIVHSVSLGSVEPYTVGVYEPPEATAGSAPLIVERVALAGCITRVDRDTAGSGTAGQIFGGVFLDGDPAMSATERAAAPAAIAALYRRALRRDVETAESDRLVAMYDEVVTEGSAAPTRDWAVLACFAVLTTTESVFY